MKEKVVVAGVMLDGEVLLSVGTFTVIVPGSETSQLVTVSHHSSPLLENHVGKLGLLWPSLVSSYRERRVGTK
jgi:hypothetical protein